MLSKALIIGNLKAQNSRAKKLTLKNKALDFEAVMDALHLFSQGMDRAKEGTSPDGGLGNEGAE